MLQSKQRFEIRHSFRQSSPLRFRHRVLSFHSSINTNSSANHQDASLPEKEASTSLGSPLSSANHQDASLPPEKEASTSLSSPLQSIDPNDMLPSGFQSRRLLCFVGIVAAYSGLYFTRGSLTYSAPLLLADKTMAISLTNIGLMTSAFPLAYGISKFLGGVLGAKFSSSLMLAGEDILQCLITLDPSGLTVRWSRRWARVNCPRQRCLRPVK